jgi:1,4-alpha-glucan branching enzyme
MDLTIDILTRRQTRFVLWSPREQSQNPRLILGKFKAGNPPSIDILKEVELKPAAGIPSGLWELRADAPELALTAGDIYHYWLEVDDSRSPGNAARRIGMTDPFAGCVDWRAFVPGAPDYTQPASVVRYAGNGQLEECDPNGETPHFPAPDEPQKLPANNQLVIYELPTAWALSNAFSQPERGVATFLDVAALAQDKPAGANFAELGILTQGIAYLEDLGVNAVELLPPADSRFNREWGYGTSHYLAPDYELGYPEGHLSPTANRDLAALVAALHAKNIRFFVDVVMAFAQEDPYNHIDAPNFHIDKPEDTPDDPDAKTSGRSGGRRDIRNGFGSTLWRYAKFVTTYDPVSGRHASISPAAQFMLVYVTRWMRDFRVDGLRLDSVENIANWDFIKAFKDRARALFAERWNAAGQNPANANDIASRMLVVGEELELPFGLLRSERLDGLWNESFQARIRAAILGEPTDNDNFEWTVRKAINCLTPDGFTDGAQVINYVTKHDVEGRRHERLCTMLRFLPREQIEKRIKLAFVCLLTSVGIPMMLAGEEFADQHDLFGAGGIVTQNGGKQVDPVNFSRLTAAAREDPNDPDAFFADMRRKIFAYVKALVKFRTTAPALAVNDTHFIWTDFGDGKRVLVWQRGRPNDVPVIVVANFSDFASAPGADYRIPTWPTPTPAKKKWIDVSQNSREVDPAFVGREAIFSWEAKVYTLVDA